MFHKITIFPVNFTALDSCLLCLFRNIKTFECTLNSVTADDMY